MLVLGTTIPVVEVGQGPKTRVEVEGLEGVSDPESARIRKVRA